MTSFCSKKELSPVTCVSLVLWWFDILFWLHHAGYRFFWDTLLSSSWLYGLHPFVPRFPISRPINSHLQDSTLPELLDLPLTSQQGSRLNLQVFQAENLYSGLLLRISFSASPLDSGECIVPQAPVHVTQG